MNPMISQLPGTLKAVDLSKKSQSVSPLKIPQRSSHIRKALYSMPQSVVADRTARVLFHKIGQSLNSKNVTLAARASRFHNY
ncbi:hypothetical protein B0T10DRAFT_195434 [Thelonectria olida]|uniref:Uncharacterized protein n=1 Tax=Thelonectria olida TaxID=1576542 RepID=A0A9P8VT27_9HYPO|nr:hypothetical protein B0T10DRAFT_195434 [Thelonectria olida]